MWRELTGSEGRAAARGGPRAPGPRGGLHQPQLPPQLAVLPVAAAHLQPQPGAAAGHQLADLRHGGGGQHLHDGRQLRVQGLADRHLKARELKQHEDK